ncbi:unnamed protein product [Brugia timori]|uniref:Uncharacterized protein n=1 Tax=Brugia timori TaxID=42155 RepID=A0A3P7UWN1_9BILA|nr:unnamed protein product [Brugia timori]
MVAPSVTPIVIIFVTESVFCPAVETCSCPWKAGYGIWDSCRRQINSRCYGISKS